MTQELWARCPGCGSLWTAPAFNHRMWECRACHSIFPVEPAPSHHPPDTGDEVILATRFAVN